jgi:major intracellular serine protease
LNISLTQSHHTKPAVINYGVSAINAPSFWKEGYEGQGSIVAVIDSGCNIKHPELKDNIIGGINFTKDNNSDPNNVTDYSGHGTHVSGIIAASNQNNIIGVAPKAKLLILKVVGENTIGSYENLIKAIDFVINWRSENNEKIDIISLSLGGRKDDKDLKAVIKKAISNNVFVVVSAGNYGDGSELTNEVLYPGYYKEVIQVGSVDDQFQPNSFNNTNVNIDFLAPGSAIYSTYFDGYEKLSGTSMAAPHVSGAIALILNFFKSNNTHPTQELVYQYLLSHSLFLKDFSNKTQGNGVIRL